MLKFIAFCYIFVKNSDKNFFISKKGFIFVATNIQKRTIMETIAINNFASTPSILFNVNRDLCRPETTTILSRGNQSTTAIMATSTVLSKDFIRAIFPKFALFAQINNTATLKTYKNALNHFATYCEENGVAINTINRDDVVLYQSFLIHGDDTHAKKSPATTNLYLTATKIFLQFLTHEGALSKDITTRIKNVKRNEGHARDYFTVNQIREIINQKRLSYRDRAILAVAFTCGLRTIEIARCNIEDLRTIGDKTVLFIHGKGRNEKKDFQIISPKVESILRRYLSTRRDRNNESSPLFVSTSTNYTGRLSTNTISKIMKTAFKSCGFDSPRLTAHSTRSSSIMVAVSGGETLENIREFARHKNIQTTMIYIHEGNRLNNTVDATIANRIFN